MAAERFPKIRLNGGGGGGCLISLFKMLTHMLTQYMQYTHAHLDSDAWKMWVGVACHLAEGRQHKEVKGHSAGDGVT